MDTQPASYLFKETRINFDSALPYSTVIVRLPVPGTLRSVRGGQKRPVVTEIPASDDENAYKLRHLASASSIYHRQHHDSPRSFVWRILEGGRALSIAAVDLCKQENATENPLTLRLLFGSPIRSGCIALADSIEHDVLLVYALTEANELYCLTLRPDFFRRRASTEDTAQGWCKIYQSGAFNFKHPHRLVATAPGQVLITLHDGGILKLSRKPGEDASQWTDTFYNDGGWKSGLKSLVPWQGSNTVKYGNANMELSAITAIETAEVGGVSCAFAVSLDHKLRIWEMETGRQVYTGDILRVERRQEELGKWVIHPSQSQLVKVIQDVDGRVIVVTYSPHGAGEFKFWRTNGLPDGEEVELIDLFPEHVLKPPPPTTDVWTVADFSISLQNEGLAKASLWILWKNNITYRVQTVTMNLHSSTNTESSWRLAWAAVAVETLATTPLPTTAPNDAEDSSEKWLNYILFPGKYTTATIETALSIYERSQGESKQAVSRNNKSLTERICSVVGSSATLPTSANGELDFSSFRSSTDAQWRRFYRLIVELDKQRGEALALGFDHEAQLPVVATADGLSVIRDCSQLERLWHNPDEAFGGQAETVSRLLISAAAFKENFSSTLQHACDVQLRAELFQEPSLTDQERLQSFYDKCNFAGQIGDEDFSQLLANLGGSFKDVTLRIFEQLFASMSTTLDLDGRIQRQPLAPFGRKIVVKGVQEIVDLHRSICLDQLVLLAFIEGEIDQNEEGMNLDTATVHRQLMEMLERLELLEWLATTELSIMPLKTERTNNESFASSMSMNDESSAKKQGEMKTVTVLEGTLAHLMGLIAHSDMPAPSLINDLLIRVCDPNSDLELQPALIQAFLIKTERPDLALEFSRFCSQDPFSTYIQGRACLAAKDLAAAAVYFEKAAFGLSRPEARDSDRHSASLLNDFEWNLLHDGLPSYYSHIVALFDASKSHSYVIDFARLALQSASPTTNTKAIYPAAKTPLTEGVRTDLLSRLFSAALHTSRYDLACTTLHLIGDTALQSNYLRALVNAMCDNASVGEMLELPWLGTENKVDDVLSAKAKAVADVNAGVPWHMILYSWRIRRGDFRGAATVAYERLQKLQQLGNTKAVVLKGSVFEHDGHAGRDELDTAITRQYLQIINVLACVEPEQAWIFVEGVKKNGAKEKRRVMRLEELRGDLQKEMDRIEDLKRGRFTFDAEDEDIDMDA